MVTFTVSDGTTTITFDAFTKVRWNIGTKTFIPIPFPDNEGQDVVFEGQFSRFWVITWQLKDDVTWPSSGDSGFDKFLTFMSYLMGGGLNDYLQTVTWETPDSTLASPQTVSYAGKIKNLKLDQIGGKTVAVIEGTFELWESSE